MTLPLIYTLQVAEESIRRKIIYIVKNQNTQKDKVEEVIALVRQHGGIEYARSKMEAYQKEAIDMLRSFPASEARDAMEDLVAYVTSRKY